MVDKNSTISQILAENPSAIDIFNSYGIPCYGNTENQLSSVEDVSIRYGINVDNILNDVNNNGTNSGLY